MILFITSAFAADPPTIPVPAGKCVPATVDSFLIARPRMEQLVALASVGQLTDDLTEQLRESASALDACSAAEEDAAKVAEDSSIQLERLNRSLLIVKRERNLAAGIAVVVGVASTAAIVGAFASNN